MPKTLKVRCVKCARKQKVKVPLIRDKDKIPFTCTKCGQKNAVNIQVVRYRVNQSDLPQGGRDEISPADKLGS